MGKPVDVASSSNNAQCGQSDGRQLQIFRVEESERSEKGLQTANKWKRSVEFYVQVYTGKVQPTWPSSTTTPFVYLGRSYGLGTQGIKVEIPVQENGISEVPECYYWFWSAPGKSSRPLFFCGMTMGGYILEQHHEGPKTNAKITTSRSTFVIFIPPSKSHVTYGQYHACWMNQQGEHPKLSVSHFRGFVTEVPPCERSSWRIGAELRVCKEVYFASSWYKHISAFSRQSAFEHCTPVAPQVEVRRRSHNQLKCRAKFLYVVIFERLQGSAIKYAEACSALTV